MSSLLSQKHLQDEQTAYEWVEAHLWPEGPICPHCGSVERISKMGGKATRFGLYKCYACRSQFRVTVGTIFEKSHVPLYLWLQAFFLLAGSKKGISCQPAPPHLGHTLRRHGSWAIASARPCASVAPVAHGRGGIVEIDETIYGRASTHPKGRKRPDPSSATRPTRTSSCRW